MPRSELGSRGSAARDIRAVLPAERHRRSWLAAGLLLIGAGLPYAVASGGLLVSESVWPGFVLAGVKALSMAMLFIVGHDACHGSLAPSPGMNAILGRLAFLPTWHPYACWEHGHNRLHHCWTNLKGRDYGWVPLSVEEYRALPRWRRWLERFYRSLPGFGFYYLREVWWRHMIWPDAADRGAMKRATQRGDRALVAAFALAEIGAAIGSAAALGHSIPGKLCIFVLLPHLLWNWTMGFVVFLHHTHPKVVWYDTVDAWSFYRAQVAGTVHVIFPRWLNVLFFHIMEHSAHHVDPKVPLTALPKSQRALEECFGEEMVVTRLSVSEVRAICRRCRLYDYTQRRWLNWDGLPT